MCAPLRAPQSRGRHKHALLLLNNSDAVVVRELPYRWSNSARVLRS